MANADPTSDRQTGPWGIGAPPMRYEVHYGDRLVRCFTNRPTSLFAMFREAVSRNPSGEALVAGSTRLSWAELDREVAARALSLAHAGIERGDRVALLLPNGLEFPITLLAVARLGAIGVPLSARSREPEVRYALNQCEATAVVFDPLLAAALPTEGDAPTLRLRRSIDAWPPTPSPARGSLDLDPAVDEDDCALIMYTSGTTGHPKGAMVTHLNLVHVAMQYEHCMRLTMDDRALVAVPMSHVTGIAAHIATVIRCASTLVAMDMFRAADFLALASRERITHTVLVPAMYNLCLRDPQIARVDLSTWRVGGYGGAPMPSATIAALERTLPRLSLMNCYGATETVAPVAMMPPGETARHPDRVGRAIPASAIIAVDDEGREVPPDTPGELWLSGPTVVRGYWRDDEATRASFTGGFWRSGDIGAVSADGLVAVHDRKKDMINRGGHKVYAIEVENVLCAHPSIVEAAIVATPCPVLGERVHAFIVTREPVTEANGAALVSALRAHCDAQLSDYKVPETFTMIDGPLPRNTNGKVLKRELREQAKAQGTPA